MLKVQLRNITLKSEKNKREQDFMQFELDELKDASLRPGEDEELEEKISLLQNSEKIYENLAGAYQMSSEDEYSVISALKKISDMVTETAPYSSELEELSERLNELYYDFEDICSSIRDSRDNAVFSPEELDAYISRIETINRLKNKHGKSIVQLLSYQEELEKTLSELENSDEIQEELKKQLSKCENALTASCEKLSAARKQAAEELEKEITRELKQLNFNDAEFSISFTEADTFSPEGTDIAEFMISTNRGEPLKPLSRIASGGEMSRIMLAFKKIVGDYDEIPTMIFDEIDSGISGITASIVGKKLREISENHQIICITHLPQIAAFGEHNYKIQKSSDDKMTYTTVSALSENEKTNEIARLLGGANITDTTLKSAKELIDASVK